MAHKSNEINRADKKYKNKYEGFKLLIKEILSNAFHAILLNDEENQQEINLNVSIKKNDDDAYKSVSIHLTDTGCGFEKEDKKYFEDLDEPNPHKIKHNLPSKGEGRLSLCYFTDYSHYKTVFREDNTYYQAQFNYPDFGDELFDSVNCIKMEDQSDVKTGTTLEISINTFNKLSSAKTFFEKEWETWIDETFFPYLISNKIKLYINGTLRTASTLYQNRSFKSLINHKSIDFEVYFLPQNHNTYGIDIYYIAENMVLEKKEYKLDWSVPYTKVLVASSFFDERIDPVGIAIEITDEERIIINTSTESVCKDFFKNDLEKININNEKTKSVLINENPFLDGLIESVYEYKESSKEKMYEDAYLKIGRQQRELLGTKNLGEKSLLRAENLASRNLMQYILLRELLINQLEDEKQKPENYFHNKIMKMNTVSLDQNIDTITLNTPNLWVIDERFMSYQKAFSVKTIKSIMSSIGENTGSSISDDGVPDILVLLSDEDTKDGSADIIIIELKDRYPGKRKIRDIDGEMRERIAAIYDNKNPLIRRVFTFGIIDLNDKVRKELRNNGYRELHGHTEYFYKYANVIMDDDSSVNAVLNLLSWNALIKDARLRNKTFMTILKESIKQYMD